MKRQNLDVNAIVEHAEYKACSTSGVMLVVVLMAHLSKNGEQKVWDNMMINHESLLAVKIGRARAKELAVACGLSKRPDEASEYEGHEVCVRLTVDDDGEWCVLKYLPAEDKELKPVDGGNLTF